MRKLELKDIAAYLPYNLHIMRRAWDEEEEVEVFEEVTSDWIIKYITFDYLIHERCKPILRPMSDLTKSIVVKGYNDDKEFVPIQHLYDICSTPPNGYNPSDFIDESDEEWSFSDLVEAFDYDKILVCINLLNQWHFDYRNLIEEGLAIDINTLNQSDKLCGIK